VKRFFFSNSPSCFTATFRVVEVRVLFVFQRLILVPNIVSGKVPGFGGTLDGLGVKWVFTNSPFRLTATFRVVEVRVLFVLQRLILVPNIV